MVYDVGECRMKILIGKLQNNPPKRRELLIPLADEYLDKSFCLKVGLFRFYVLKRVTDINRKYSYTVNILVPEMKIIGVKTRGRVQEWWYTDKAEIPCDFGRYVHKRDSWEDFQWFFLSKSND